MRASVDLYLTARGYPQTLAGMAETGKLNSSALVAMNPIFVMATFHRWNGIVREMWASEKCL